MPDPDLALEVAREWISKAENDLKTAAHVLKLGEHSPTDSVCFHAQQCVEKYVKAVLVLAGTDFPKTHDLERLIAMCPKSLRPSLSAAEQALLTEYATGARYPGWGEIRLAEARKAVSLARRVRKELRAVLPRKVWAARSRKP